MGAWWFKLCNFQYWPPTPARVRPCTCVWLIVNHKFTLIGTPLLIFVHFSITFRTSPQIDALHSIVYLTWRIFHFDKWSLINEKVVIKECFSYWLSNRRKIITFILLKLGLDGPTRIRKVQKLTFFLGLLTTIWNLCLNIILKNGPSSWVTIITIFYATKLICYVHHATLI